MEGSFRMIGRSRAGGRPKSRAPSSEVSTVFAVSNLPSTKAVCSGLKGTSGAGGARSSDVCEQPPRDMQKTTPTATLNRGRVALRTMWDGRSPAKMFEETGATRGRPSNKGCMLFAQQPERCDAASATKAPAIQDIRIAPRRYVACLTLCRKESSRGISYYVIIC